MPWFFRTGALRRHSDALQRKNKWIFYEVFAKKQADKWIEHEDFDYGVMRGCDIVDNFAETILCIVVIF